MDQKWAWNGPGTELDICIKEDYLCMYDDNMLRDTNNFENM